MSPPACFRRPDPPMEPRTRSHRAGGARSATARASWRAYPLVGICVALAVAGCGGVSQLRIIGSNSFDGVANGGNFHDAVSRLGRPTQVYSPGAGTPVDCVAEWASDGVQATYQDLANLPEGRPCEPASEFRLVDVTLRGRWTTDRGLRVGDPVSRISIVYPGAKLQGCVTDELPRGVIWSLDRVKDPLGAPGSYICALAAIASHGKIIAFTMSNRGASE